MWVQGIREKSKRFVGDEAGTTATEYAVMLAMIIMVCIGAVTALGTKTSGLFPDMAGYL